jgi:hypothetical protein
VRIVTWNVNSHDLAPAGSLVVAGESNVAPEDMDVPDQAAFADSRPCDRAPLVANPSDAS